MLQQTVLAGAVIVPTKMVEDGIEAETFYRDAFGAGLIELTGDIGQPRWPSIKLDPGFCKDDRPSIAADRPCRNRDRV